MKITGFIETYLTDKNGVKRKVGEQKNTIDSTLYEALAKHFDNNYDIALNDLFDSYTSQPYADGINFTASNTALTISYGHPAMITTLSQPSSNKLRATGVYTNNESESIRAFAPQLGKSWIRETVPDEEDDGYFNDFVVAKTGGSWTAVDIPVGEVLTIIWTITFTVH